MKKLLLLPVLLLTLVSCQKKQCWKCSVHQNTQPNGIISDYTHVEIVCDKTKNEIRQHERNNTWVKKAGIVIVTQTTTCE